MKASSMATTSLESGISTHRAVRYARFFHMIAGPRSGAQYVLAQATGRGFWRVRVTDFAGEAGRGFCLVGTAFFGVVARDFAGWGGIGGVPSLGCVSAGFPEP